MTRTRSRRAFIVCLAVASLFGGTLARTEELGRSADTVIAPFVNDQTIGVAAIDLSSPGTASTIIGFWRALACREPDQAEVPDGIRKALAYLVPGSDRYPSENNLRPRAGIGQVYLVAIWSDPTGFFTDPQRERKTGLEDALFLVVPEATEEVIAGLRELLPEPGKNGWPMVWACREIHSCAVIADSRLLDRLTALKALPRPEIGQALAAAGQRPVRIAVAPPALFSRAASEILTTPAPGTTQPLGQYLAQIRWIGIGADAAAGLPQLRLLMTLVPGSDHQRMLEFLGQITPVLDELLARASTQDPTDRGPQIELPAARLDGDNIVWTLDGSATAQLAPLVKQLAEENVAAAEIEIDGKHLKAIGFAFHRYHDAHKQFPNVAIRDREGKPILSWRVAILPYLEQSKLYERFHLDEPWDSEHNRTLVDEIPAEFRTARTPQGRTRFLAPVGENLAFTPEPSELNVRSFSDGTSATIRLVEADPEHSVIWSKPEDLLVNLENPKQGITDGKAIFLTGFADASVHRFKGSIRPLALRAFFTRNGREPSPFNNLYPPQ